METTTQSKATQRTKLLSYLETNKSITSLEAVQKLLILRPSNRIQELKEIGYPIQTDIIWKRKEDGGHTHYARYTLRA